MGLDPRSRTSYRPRFATAHQDISLHERSAPAIVSNQPHVCPSGQIRALTHRHTEDKQTPRLAGRTLRRLRNACDVVTIGAETMEVAG